jgi:hypothetical protein
MTRSRLPETNPGNLLRTPFWPARDLSGYATNQASGITFESPVTRAKLSCFPLHCSDRKNTLPCTRPVALARMTVTAKWLRGTRESLQPSENAATSPCHQKSRPVLPWEEKTRATTRPHYHPSRGSYIEKRKHRQQITRRKWNGDFPDNFRVTDSSSRTAGFLHCLHRPSQKMF